MIGGTNTSMRADIIKWSGCSNQIRSSEPPRTTGPIRSLISEIDFDQTRSVGWKIVFDPLDGTDRELISNMFKTAIPKFQIAFGEFQHVTT